MRRIERLRCQDRENLLDEMALQSGAMLRRARQFVHNLYPAQRQFA